MNTKRHGRWFYSSALCSAALAVALLVPGGAAEAKLTETQKCQMGVAKGLGKYAQCLKTQDANQAKGKPGQDVKCSAKLEKAFVRARLKAVVANVPAEDCAMSEAERKTGQAAILVATGRTLDESADAELIEALETCGRGAKYSSTDGRCRVRNSSAYGLPVLGTSGYSDPDDPNPPDGPVPVWNEMRAMGAGFAASTAAAQPEHDLPPDEYRIDFCSNAVRGFLVDSVSSMIGKQFVCSSTAWLQAIATELTCIQTGSWHEDPGVPPPSWDGDPRIPLPRLEFTGDLDSDWLPKMANPLSCAATGLGGGSLVLDQAGIMEFVDGFVAGLNKAISLEEMPCPPDGCG